MLHCCIATSGQQLDEEGVAQAFFLSCGFLPTMKLRDLRAEDRGELPLGWLEEKLVCGCPCADGGGF